MRISAPRLVGSALALLGAGACGSETVPTKPVEVKFAARVGDAPLDCTKSYQVGSPPSAAKPLGLRAYVYDVALVRASGERVEVMPTDHGKWENSGVTLLDFVKKTAGCDDGTTDTNTTVVGQVPDHGDYVGLHFRIGVPDALDHLNGATQPSPLNDPNLFWSWQAGYIFMQTAWATESTRYWEFSLSESVSAGGATSKNCTAAAKDAGNCPATFAPDIDLAHFDVARDTVKFDLAALVAKVNLARSTYTPYGQQPSKNPSENVDLDYVAGCHMDPVDAECSELLESLGIDYATRSASDPKKQTFVSKL
jgi:uncharacterized repeat protein (TIGR04052 family)